MPEGSATLYIKYLFVEGFKSFPEPSGLELQAGVCVFVGANGTGKSNLTDAVTWALGENDLARLRCRSGEDLVFAGSEELLPLSSCEVTLVLDPRPERLRLAGLPAEVCKHGHAAEHTRDIPDGALTITRRAARDGVTSFFLDGVEASEADVRARLADLGVASPPVSAIRQGELDRLLLLDSGARRRLVEETVGIPELGLRHERLCSERSAALLRRERLIGERTEAVERAADLETEAHALERMRALEAEQASLRAEALLRALPPDAETRVDGSPTTYDLLNLLGLSEAAESDRRSDSWATLRLQLEQCEGRIAELGPVNTRAGADLAAARTHLAGIDGLLTAGDDEAALLGAQIDSLNTKMATLFAEGLERIEGRFRSHYELLAPGGEASLPIVEGKDGPGVDILVRPPGKVLDRVSVLSGGERSLAALSLALAVFQELDSPFFVLDEVEPALDDTNIRRVQAVLDSVADSRQLLVVSHQQRAKETGDVVFGVERNLDGASQVKFRFEPQTRRLEVFRRTWASDSLRRFPGDKVTPAPGLASNAPTRGRVMAGGTGSPMQATLMDVRGPRSGAYRPQEDGPWEGVWEAFGNPDSTGKSAPKEADPPKKTCC